MNTVIMDGSKLRNLLHTTGITQRALSAAVGVTHFNISRWCSRGEHAIRVVNMQKFAKAAGLTFDELMAKCGALHQDSPPVGLSQSETEVIETWRRLTHLNQAKAIILMDRLLNGGDVPL